MAIEEDLLDDISLTPTKCLETRVPNKAHKFTMPKNMIQVFLVFLHKKQQKGPTIEGNFLKGLSNVLMWRWENVPSDEFFLCRNLNPQHRQKDRFRTNQFILIELNQNHPIQINSIERRKNGRENIEESGGSILVCLHCESPLIGV